MNYAEICIIKRDGKREDFSISKIKNAISKAFSATGIQDEQQLVADITMNVISQFTTPTITVEEIQDLVEKSLMKVRPEVAKKYIIYREWRNTERDKKTQMKQVMDGIVAIDKNDVNLSNANMSSHTPAGQMMTFASEVTKDYTYKYLLPKRFAEAHQLGDIHIHDLDYYPTKTTTCIQYDMDDLFERGFRTKNGSIRTPQSIQSYATLATIIFQTNQNEQHGGQAIPAFDFFMAKGVAKSFRKHLASFINFYVAMENGNQADEKSIRTLIKEYLPSIKTTEAERETLRIALVALQIIIDKEHLARIVEKAYQQTRKDTHQAMEGFIHNLNTMHSRGGNQVVFSSINYGTDTSAEGRMVIEELLKATIEGLGTRGEVPVFPIQIFKVKDGVSYSEKDFEKAMKAENIEEAMTDRYEAPNFDLLLKACQTTAKALFPNFMFLDVFTFALKDGFVIDGEQGFTLQPYDQVFVRRSPGYQAQQNVQVTGEVIFGGTYAMTTTEERLSDLVKKAGGATPKAYLRGAKLIRVANDEEKKRMRDVINLMNRQFGEAMMDSLGIRVEDTFSVGIDLEKAMAQPGSEYDLVLREGDVLDVPKMNNTVKVNGAVMMPNTVGYLSDKNANYYLDQAGGYALNAKKSKKFVIYMNGQVARIKGRSKDKIEPGCEIIVPSKKNKKVNVGEILGYASSFGSLATMFATISNLIKK